MILSACSLTASFSLQAEIERVTIKWQYPVECQAGCIQTLYKAFASIPGVAEVVINQGQGQLDLRWKPKFTLNYSAINTAIRSVGPKIIDARIKVRGILSHAGSNVFLQSLGDQTTFILLSPVQANPGGYTEKYNVNAHFLTPELRYKLLNAEADFQVVTVEGPLFQPERISPLQLIVENLTLTRLGGPMLNGQPFPP